MIYYLLTSLFELFSFLINFAVGFSVKMGITFFWDKIELYRYIFAVSNYKISRQSLQPFLSSYNVQTEGREGGEIYYVFRMNEENSKQMTFNSPIPYISTNTK
jgi:hypothetical protein